MKGLRYSLGFATVIGFTAVSQAQVGIDGLWDGDWTGVSASYVGYNPSAPMGNFGAPGNENHAVAHNIYLRSDSEYVYGLIRADTSTGGSFAGLTFWNVYFNTDGVGGSDLGFEITNNRAFIPGGANYSDPLNSYLTYAVDSLGGGVEFAIKWSFFMDNPLGYAFNPTVAGGALQLRLSQGLGYSVAGGTSYGDDRLGEVFAPAAAPVPEPATMALMGVGALAAFRKRYRSKKQA